jgi:hypothetical protein
VLVIYTGPFAGYLAETPLPANLSLLVAGRERNALTFTAEHWDDETGPELLTAPWKTLPVRTSTDLLFARAVKEKVEDLKQWPALRDYQDAVIPPQGYVAGLPHWVQAGLSPQQAAQALASEQLRPEEWLAALAAGCLQASESPCTSELPAPLTTLAAAAMAEQAKEHEAASAAYARFLEFFAHAPRTAAATGPIQRAHDAMRAVLEPLTILAEQRQIRLEEADPPPPQLRFVPVVVENYGSPLVADLPGAVTDAGLWRDALTDFFRRTPESVTARAQQPAPPPGLTMLPPLADPKSANDIRTHLNKALAEANPKELVFFFFSGRGVYQGGRFHLAAAGVRALQEAEGQVSWDEAGLLSLDEVAALAAAHKDRWFIAIYDAQFTQPIFEEGRSDALLDKHLDSVRPRSAVGIAMVGQELRLLPDPDELPRQVHIWLEGRLTEGAELTGCSSSGGSPLTRALVTALTAAHTSSYQTWAEAALRSPCLAGAPVRFVLQGEPTLPPLATSRDAEELAFLGEQSPRAGLAAYLLALAGTEVANSPVLALSRAAVGVMSREETRLLPASVQAHDVIPNWARSDASARTWLNDLEGFAPNKEDLPPSADFGWVVLDLRAHLLRILQRHPEALEVLLAEPARPHLHHRRLLAQLMTLLEQARGEKDLFKAASKVEAALAASTDDVSQLRDRWRRLLDQERQLRPFRIRLDAVTPRDDDHDDAGM